MGVKACALKVKMKDRKTSEHPHYPAFPRRRKPWLKCQQRSPVSWGIQGGFLFKAFLCLAVSSEGDNLSKGSGHKQREREVSLALTTLLTPLVKLIRIQYESEAWWHSLESQRRAWAERMVNTDEESSPPSWFHPHRPLMFLNGPSRYLINNPSFVGSNSTIFKIPKFSCHLKYTMAMCSRNPPASASHYKYVPLCPAKIILSFILLIACWCPQLEGMSYEAWHLTCHFSNL